MVEHEINLTYAQLKKRPLIERWITLCCVSNEVGGGLIGNAHWLGARLADLLHEAGLSPDCDQLLMTSYDGMTIGAPTKVVMDGRDALVAIGMNGAPLPVEHGFPVRIVVPGLYGYVSACKWVVDIEATTFAERQAYWIGAAGRSRTRSSSSRASTRRARASRCRPGRPVAVAGVAWDQHVGVSAVEVQVDNGPWLPARLAAVPVDRHLAAVGRGVDSAQAGQLHAAGASDRRERHAADRAARGRRSRPAPPACTRSRSARADIYGGRVTSRQPFKLPFRRSAKRRAGAAPTEPPFDPTSWSGALIVMARVRGADLGDPDRERAPRLRVQPVRPQTARARRVVGRRSPSRSCTRATATCCPTPSRCSASAGC